MPSLANSPLTDPSLLVQHLVAGVVVHGPDGAVVQANPKACDLLGHTEAEMIGCGLDDVKWRFRREDGAQMPLAEYPAAQVLARQGPVQNCVVGIVHPQGQGVAWVLCNAYAESLDGNGAVDRIVVMLLDITERLEAERALRASEGRYRLLYQHSHDAVLILQRDGPVVAANPAACTMFLSSETQLLGHTRLQLMDPADERAHRFVDECHRQGHAQGRLRMCRRDRSTFEADVSTAQYAEADGSVMVSMVVRDASLQQAAQAALAERNLAAAASRHKSEFITRISHELRTPLNAVLGLTDVLLRDPGTAMRSTDRARVQHVFDAGTHLLELIEGLLDMSAIESGALTVGLRPVDLAGLAGQLVEQCRPLAARRSIGVELQPWHERIVVMADPGRLKQVLWNLLSNAIKYNREGGQVQVRLQASVNGQSGWGAVVVADTGMGMSAAQQSRLFRPFDRLGLEHTEITGLGIGLALTGHLVQLMGGTIDVQSQPGQGSRFVVSLPRAASEEPPAESSARDAGAAPRVEAVARRRALRLMYVDDDAVNRLVVQGIVSLQPDCVLVEAADGAQALEMARRAPPDVVLVDLLMPGMDGPQLLRHLRAEPATRDIPCIAVSAQAGKEDITHALAAGFDGYMVKPVTLPSWHAELERVLRVRKAAADGK